MSLFYVWGYLLLYGLRVSILFGFHVRCQRRRFLWTMMGKEIWILPVLLKTSCIIGLRFQSERLEKYKNYVLTSSTPPRNITPSVGTEMTYLWPSTLGKAWNLDPHWLGFEADSATYWLCDLELGHLWAWVPSTVNWGLRSDIYYIDY